MHPCEQTISSSSSDCSRRQSHFSVREWQHETNLEGSREVNPIAERKHRGAQKTPLDVRSFFLVQVRRRVVVVVVVAVCAATCAALCAAL